MDTQKSLSLHHRFEAPHTSFSHPGRFMRLLCSIILILLSAVDRVRNQFPMSNTIAAQLVSHDLPRLTTVTPYQTVEEVLSRNPIPLGLEININHCTIPKALRGVGSPDQQLAIDNAACN